MPAVVGFVSLTPRSPEECGRAMLVALDQLGPHGSRSERLGSACFGSQFAYTVPEDDFDLQPLVGGGGRYLLAADARIDNRQEIASALNIPATELSSLSDSGLLLQGWEKWGPQIVDRLLGDVALAVWDNQSCELFLARTPLSNRPLFFVQRQELIAFASLPRALFAIPAVERTPNLDPMADLLAGGIFLPGSATMFRGIESVAQGTATVIRAGGKKTFNLWSLDFEPLSIGVAEAGEAMRAELDRAVLAQSRRRSGPIACQLSGGRDSSAVATSASTLGLHPLALTAAPREGFRPVEDTYWQADESEIATQTARQAGIDHIICRSESAPLVELLRSSSTNHFQPVGNPVNFPWIRQTYLEAEKHGAKLLLTGSCGNFGLSLGGPGFLGEFRRLFGLRSWFNLAQGLHADGLSWRSLTTISFGHLAPRSAYHALWRLSGRGGEDPYRLKLLKGRFRRQAEQIRKERLGDVRAPASRRRQFAQLLAGLENGDKYSLSGWGIDVRDPTADRRFIELCYSLPVEAFIGSDEARPAYAAAFGDRLPRSVINGRQAGYQAADWFETIDPEEIRCAFRLYARHPIIDEIVDLGAVETLIEEWPKERGDATDIYDAYCNQLLGTLAVASFIDVHFPG